MNWRASNMVFLPLVVRELRVAARRPRTYYGRMVAAVIWLAITLNALLATYLVGIGKLGGLPLFQAISGAMFVWALISAFAGADSISVEKREGTIGFLFLTDLKSHDIVLGKMAAAALPAIYAASAAFPMLAICLLMGGVTAAQCAETGLAILNVFFLGQAIGMFSSALSRLRGNAMGVPLLVILLYLTACCLTIITEKKGREWPDFLFQLNNPARPVFLAVNALPGRGIAPGYWATLLVTHLHGWMFLALASWVLPRRWRENPKKAGVWKGMAEQWRYGSMAARTAFRRRLVGVNPVLWLVCRGRLSPVFGWFVLVGCVALICAGAMNSDKSWSQAYAGYFIWIIVSLQLILRMGVSAHAALLEDLRRNGSLEIILCCTPMSVEEILDGMWLVLRRYYRWPTLVLVTLEGLMFIAALIMGLRNSVNMNLLCFIIVSTILLIADLRAMAWLAMWGAMSNPRPRSAGTSAFFLISLFPWLLVGLCYATKWIRHESWLWILWPTFALVNDTIACRLAKHNLRKNFRLWAVPSYGEVLGFWGRAGRQLGLIRRRWRETNRSRS